MPQELTRQLQLYLLDTGYFQGAKKYEDGKENVLFVVVGSRSRARK